MIQSLVVAPWLCSLDHLSSQHVTSSTSSVIAQSEWWLAPNMWWWCDLWMVRELVDILLCALPWVCQVLLFSTLWAGRTWTSRKFFQTLRELGLLLQRFEVILLLLTQVVLCIPFQLFLLEGGAPPEQPHLKHFLAWCCEGGMPPHHFWGGPPINPPRGCT